MDNLIRHVQAILPAVALVFALAVGALVPHPRAVGGTVLVVPSGTGVCNGGLATLRFGSDIQLNRQSPFEVELLLSNEGDAAATNVVLGFEAAVGGQFLDEATFGNGQLWWPHGQRNSGVLYAAGDIAAGAGAPVRLTIEMLPLWGPGDPVSIFVSVVDAECVDDSVDTMFVRLAHPDGDAPTTGETTVPVRTNVIGTPTAAAGRIEAPDEGQTLATATSTPTAVPTATPTPDSAASNGTSPQNTAEAVLGEEAAPPTPVRSTATQPPTGELAPAAAAADSDPGEGGQQGLFVAALSVVALVVAGFAGRRLS